MRSVLALSCLLLLSLFGCSDAETPDANFGVESGPTVDAGGDPGTRDQPCFADSSCQGNTLACVNNPDPVCRLLCDPVANPDPCAANGQVCTGIADAGDAVCAVP